MDNQSLDGTSVVAHTSEGVEILGTPIRLDAEVAIFETFRRETPLRVSEVLADFTIIVRERVVFSGRAILRNVIDTGVCLTCEAALHDGWAETGSLDNASASGLLRSDICHLLSRWTQFYRLSPEFKAVVSDMQTYLGGMQTLCDRIEVGLRAAPHVERAARERLVSDELVAATHPVLDGLFETFESIARRIPDNQQAVHQYFIRQHLHPTLLASPFVRRVVQKPLGYAGDYEMVNMILRDPHEGSTLFGRVLNRWFINQPPAEAHRNRVLYLKEALKAETLRTIRAKRRLRVFNVGCGPAGEIQAFLAESEISNNADFTLLDFDKETLEVGKTVIEAVRAQHGRTSSITYVHKSVVQLVKASNKARSSVQPQYDFIYCAGLFDYLQDAVCRQLTELFYSFLAPEGLLVVTNVDSSNPIRHWLGYVLEWHLIYRDAGQMLALRPSESGPEENRLVADMTGVNVFLETRRQSA